MTYQNELENANAYSLQSPIEMYSSRDGECDLSSKDEIHLDSLVEL